jgi:hypothetical protein
MNVDEMRSALNGKTDELTSLLRRAEEILQADNVGVEGAVRIEESDIVLRWGKQGSEWALTIDNVIVSQASRRYRILAALHLTALRKQITMNAKALRQDLDVALETTRLFVSSLKTSVGRDG